MVSLLDSARDRQLLGATLRLWPRQAELLPLLDDPELTLVILACGRGSSKSTLCALSAIHNCVLRPDLDRLPPGRTRYCLVGAPGEAQAREFIRIAAAMVEASPLIGPMARVMGDRIDFTLPSGASTAIRALAANSATVRGMSASQVVCDEHAHFDQTPGASNDRRMLDALSGSTVPFPDAKTLLLSTPNGPQGLFCEMFQDVEAGLIPHARAVHLPTWEVRPDVTPELIEQTRRQMGDSSFDQEWGAQFIEAGGSFFTLQEVDFEQAPARPEDAVEWVAGLDPAFHGDRFGVALVGEAMGEPGTFLVGRVEAIDPGQRLRSLEARRAREDETLRAVWEILEPYHAVRPLKILSDQHQGDAVKSYFGRKGVEAEIVSVTAKIQTEAFESAKSRLIDGSLRCWSHPLLLDELRRVTARAVGATKSVLLPKFKGGHCDAASALALACWAVREGSHPPAAVVTVAPAGVAALHRRYSDSVFG
jgi:phage terminase large subunit-like protein